MQAIMTLVIAKEVLLVFWHLKSCQCQNTGIDKGDSTVGSYLLHVSRAQCT